MKKVEQINNNNIVIDYDETLSQKDIFDILKSDFKISNKSNPYVCNFNQREIKLYVKQVTYLGHPHLEFKKRIQISRGWQYGLRDEFAFLLGIYKYKETILYVLFDKKNFIHRNTNNSSAHLSTFDLLSAQQKGIFTKKDIRGNLITCLRRDKINEFLCKIVGNENILSNEILLFENFKHNLDKSYNGIQCYKEMILENYRNKFQPEWFGFYIEYKFEKFLEENPKYKSICFYQSKKSKNEIDLDLNFKDDFLGDLKTHSNDSGAILGNDLDNVNKTLERYGKLWYIVINHDTILDSERGFEVTKFWNEVLKKKNLMSYSRRMKHSVLLTNLMILEINIYNQKYLSIFNQGINSNSLPRNPKIKINKKVINNFLIYDSKFYFITFIFTLILS